jgi:hypothetical protein
MAGLARFPDAGSMADCLVETVDVMAGFSGRDSCRVDFEPDNRVSCNHTGGSSSIVYLLMSQVVAA